MLEHNVLDFSKCIDGNSTLSNVLINGEREPIVIKGTLVHPLVQLKDINLHQLSLDWLQIIQGSIVASQKLTELIDMNHVIFFLKSDVDNSLWNVLSNSVKKFGFSDDHFELRMKVDMVLYFITLFLSL